MLVCSCGPSCYQFWVKTLTPPIAPAPSVRVAIAPVAMPSQADEKRGVVPVVGEGNKTAATAAVAREDDESDDQQEKQVNQVND